jgi:transcriptional regulator with XRE-family HTH domain
MGENRIGSERIRLRLSQQDLANRLEISNKTLSQWEQDNSRCPTKYIKQLAEIFDCC